MFRSNGSGRRAVDRKLRKDRGDGGGHPIRGVGPISSVCIWHLDQGELFPEDFRKVVTTSQHEPVLRAGKQRYRSGSVGCENV
jgi:hypothetical protein